MNAAGSGRGKGLALIGYRGTGKSTVGRLLADLLDLPFLDADVELVRRSGRSIAEIFAESGEAAFRDLEESTLAAIVAGPPAVVATGGGAILREANREALRRFGLVIWLRAEPDRLAERLAADVASSSQRPSLTASGTLTEIREVLALRTPLYQSASDASVATDGQSPAEVARAVLEILGGVAGREQREPSPCS